MVTRYHLRRARRLDRGESFSVSRQEWDRRPPGFEEARSLRPGTVYREAKPTDALAIRVRGDRVVLRRDRYNPRHHPLKHVLYDRLDVARRAPSGVASLVLGRC